MEHFNYSEFDSPDQQGSGQLMNELLLSMLDEARDRAGIPFKVNSGVRTKAHNKAVGGKSASSHLIPDEIAEGDMRPCAVDIHCNDSRSRWTIIKALIDSGFNRIGVAKTFIHADIDKNKSDNVIWLY